MKGVEEKQKEAFPRDALLALYAETEARIRSHRDTLWQEIRHFSWVLAAVVTAAGYTLAKSHDLIAIAWIPPFLLGLSSTIGFLASKVIKQEREEFLRSIMVTRKIEYFLGLHKHIENPDISEKKGFGGYLFTPKHIDIFKKAEELWHQNDKNKESWNAEQHWIEFRTKREPAPFDIYRKLFFIHGFMSIGATIFSLYFLWLKFEFYFPPFIK